MARAMRCASWGVPGLSLGRKGAGKCVSLVMMLGRKGGELGERGRERERERESVCVCVCVSVCLCVKAQINARTQENLSFQPTRVGARQVGPGHGHAIEWRDPTGNSTAIDDMAKHALPRPRLHGAQHVLLQRVCSWPIVAVPALLLGCRSHERVLSGAVVVQLVDHSLACRQAARCHIRVRPVGATTEIGLAKPKPLQQRLDQSDMANLARVAGCAHGETAVVQRGHCILGQQGQ